MKRQQDHQTEAQPHTMKSPICCMLYVLLATESLSGKLNRNSNECLNPSYR